MRLTRVSVVVFGLALVFGIPVHQGSSLLAETSAERDQRMAWWRKARFGMFIHWGLYAIPAGEWKGERLDNPAHCTTWTRHFLSIPTADWDPLIHEYEPVWYNPRDWARLAKAAGMQYAVLTTKHHEGFCLFDSKLTDFTAMHAPARRDLVKEWLEAFRAEGIRVGFYYSLIDWHHPDYPVVGDRLHPERKRPETLAEKRDLNKYLDYLHGQVRELMTRYGKIDVLWFDFSYDKLTGEAWRGTELLTMVRSLQPGIIVNDRVGLGGDFSTPEQRIPPNGIPGKDWETCMTMNGSWGYKRHDHAWKSTEALIRNLIDIASKGGNYLLNVGPTAEGVIPEASVNRLTHIGRWMRINGESIYGTSASPFSRQLPWGRCTRKLLDDGTTRLYLQVFDWPKDGRLAVPGLASQASQAYLLVDSRRAPLPCRSHAEVLTIQVPAAAPDSLASVIALDIEGDLKIVQPRLRADADGVFHLHGRDAELHGTSIRYDGQEGRESVGYWTDAKDWISWPIQVEKGGTFRVEVVYGCAKGEGGEYVVEVNGQRLAARARETGGWFERVTDLIGTVDLQTTGARSLSIRLTSKPGLAVMDLQAVILRPMAHP
ncbi:MAG: alpha-L-fucosidase [Phycisphaerae bacterium]|nr:alpha-L-fucosidase [Phycisphaerae bacterium]